MGNEPKEVGTQNTAATAWQMRLEEMQVAASAPVSGDSRVMCEQACSFPYEKIAKLQDAYSLGNTDMRMGAYPNSLIIRNQGEHANTMLLQMLKSGPVACEKVLGPGNEAECMGLIDTVASLPQEKSRAEEVAEVGVGGLYIALAFAIMGKVVDRFWPRGPHGPKDPPEGGSGGGGGSPLNVIRSPDFDGKKPKFSEWYRRSEVEVQPEETPWQKVGLAALLAGAATAVVTYGPRIAAGINLVGSRALLLNPATAPLTLAGMFFPFVQQSLCKSDGQMCDIDSPGVS